jgi:hypothetical protein
VTPDDYKRAAELLEDPDGEDCERFASRYGSHLLRTQRMLRVAAEALGVIGGGYCFCSAGRDPDKAKHEPECADLRVAIAEAAR